MTIKKTCKRCNETFEVQPYRKDTAVYCSRKCRGDSTLKIGYICKVCNNKFKDYASNNRKCCSRTCSNKYTLFNDKQVGYWLGKKRDKRTIKKISLSKKGKSSWNLGIRGILSHSWRNGKTRLRARYYQWPEYKRWRTSVFERDNFTCQECGSRNCYIEAHHIKSFNEYPELRFDIDNGQTLCWDCHIETRRGLKQ